MQQLPSHSVRICTWTLTLCALLVFTSCGVFREPTIDMCQIIDQVSIIPVDGRDHVPDLQCLSNESSQDTITLYSVELIGSVDIELVDVFTFPIPDYVSGPVPPLEGDKGDGERVGRWETRIPLVNRVVDPGVTLEVAMVLRPGLSVSCPYARGYRLEFEQYGRRHTITVETAMLYYDEKTSDMSVCDHVRDYIDKNPLK